MKFQKNGNVIRGLDVADPSQDGGMRRASGAKASHIERLSPLLNDGDGPSVCLGRSHFSVICGTESIGCQCCSSLRSRAPDGGELVSQVG